MADAKVRDQLENGQIYDHHFVEYEYADGTLLYSQARQIPNCWRSISETAVGTLGKAVFESKEFTMTGPRSPPPQRRYGISARAFLFKAIRELPTTTRGRTAERCTHDGYPGRMATYSGQEVKWGRCDSLVRKPSPWIDEFQFPAPVMPDAEAAILQPFPATGPALKCGIDHLTGRGFTRRGNPVGSFLQGRSSHVTIT
jgi:hypothetical protein